MAEATPELQVFLAALQTGEHDDALDEIESALDYRRKVLIRRMTAKLTPGTKVRFITNIKPKYLGGLTGEIADTPGRKDGEVYVKTPNDRKYRRFANGEVRVPTNLIEVI